jgi:hypothetical protein
MLCPELLLGDSVSVTPPTFVVDESTPWYTPPEHMVISHEVLIEALNEVELEEL